MLDDGVEPKGLNGICGAAAANALVGLENPGVAAEADAPRLDDDLTAVCICGARPRARPGAGAPKVVAWTPGFAPRPRAAAPRPDPRDGTCIIIPRATLQIRREEI